MQAELDSAEARVDEFRYCSHHPGGIVAAFRVACECRKPAAGLILDLLRDFSLDPTACHLFGDMQSEIEAAAAAGVAATLVDEHQRLLDLVKNAFGE